MTYKSDFIKIDIDKIMDIKDLELEEFVIDEEQSIRNYNMLMRYIHGEKIEKGA